VKSLLFDQRLATFAVWVVLFFDASAAIGPGSRSHCYLLNAVSGAIFGVMMPVVAADLTRRSGGFNLVLGALGVAISVGASSSTFFAGLSAAALGANATALALALVGLCALFVVWGGMPETHARASSPESERVPGKATCGCTGTGYAAKRAQEKPLGKSPESQMPV
jgi:membrane associated rhomboid family serine protease